MKTFLEVEGKMGPVPASQFRPPLPDTNPNIRKNNTAKKKKESKTQEVQASNSQAYHNMSTLTRAPPKPENNVPDS